MYTNGLKDRFGSPLISKRDGDAIYATKDSVKGLFGRQFITAENATGTNECNAIQFAPAKIPHNIDIDEVSIPVINGYATPLYLAAWYINTNNVKTYIGLSDNAVAWQAGTNATWKFTNTPLNVPDNCKLEVYLTANAPAAGATEVGGGWVQINCYANYSGSGSVRYGHDWYSGRDVLAYFTQVGHVIGSDIHLTDTQKDAIKEVIDGNFVKDNANVETSYLTDCPGEGETCGVVINSAHTPHDIDVNKITLYLNSINTDDPTYIYVLLSNNGAITRVGLSDEGKTWKNTGLVTWTFNTNHFTIPTGANVYLYFTNDPSTATGLTAPSTVKHIVIRYRELSNSGSMKHYNKWYDNRLIYAIFTETNNEYVEEKFLDAKYLTKEEADIKFGTKEEMKPYDWTPDWYHAVKSEGVTEYTAPINGWVSTMPNAYDLNSEVSINGNVAGYSTSAGTFQILVREGDLINFTGKTDFLFAPCNAEQCDWRDTKTNYDIWKNAICYDSNGTPYVQDLYVPSAASWAENIRIPHNLTITKVEDEKAYNGENFVCNIQSTEIENATFLFYGFNVNGVDTVCPIQTWDSDLNKLLSGGYMFCRSNLSSFSGNLDSMTRGYQMFYNSRLASFNTPMPKVVNGYLMFATTALTNFNVQTLPNLSNGEAMFAYTNISSFTTDMPKLSNAREMFMATPSLTTFDADLSNLKTGWKMFGDGDSALAKLSDDSFQNIASSIKDINGMAKDDDSLWKYDTVDTYGTVKPNAGTIGYDYRGIIHLNSQDGHANNATVTQAMETIVSKGWIAYLNGSVYQTSGEIVVPTGPNDVSVANGYIPNASAWGSNVRQAKNLVIVRVENGVAYSE